MRIDNRKITALIMLYMLLILHGISALAQSDKVADMADLLTSEEEEKLQERLEGIVEAYDADLAVVTTDSTGGKSPMQYADDYYEQNGYGIGDDLDGLMLVISMEERDWWITTFGSAARVFTDYRIDEIGEEIVDSLGAGEYYRAFTEFADLAEQYWEQDAQEEARAAYDGHGTYQPHVTYYSERESMPVGKRAVIASVIGLAAALAVFLILRSQLKSVGYEKTAVDYVRKDSFRLTRARDVFLYRNIIKRKIEKPENHGSGNGRHGGPHGGGSSIHGTSGGRRAGGGGGKF